MKDESKTKQELSQELTSLRQRITELERSELALRESEVRYRELFENMGSCVAVYEAHNNGEDFIFKEFNAAAEVLDKTPRVQAIGRSVVDVFPGVKDFGLFDVFQRVYRTGKSERLPLTFYEDKKISGWRDNYVYKLPSGDIVAVYEDITEHKQAEEALRESEERFRILSEAAFEAIAIHEGGILLNANEQYFEMFGHEPGEALGKEMMSLTFAPESIEFAKNQVATGSLEPYEFIGLRKDGTRFPGEVRVRKMTYKGRNVRFGALRDITERKRAEEKIKASLWEKEILLNEIHHRVKNNMQVISSLLKLQASACGNPELTERLNESQSRIHAMALVHEKLYNSNDFTRIDLAGYVRTLSQELFQSHKINQWEIALIVQTDGEVYVDVNKAIPCGLILNELISNALKHAFPGGRQGKLQILIRETENTEIEIVVRDNGLGLPDDVDIHAPRSLGLDLVNGMVTKQLDGQIEVRRDKGTEFRITFSL